LQKLHFIAGLPRSGSTLLAALLNQNPAFRAGMSSPLFGIFNAALSAMGGANEFAIFLNDAQKRAMLKGLVAGYFDPLLTEMPYVNTCFDTNRMWMARLPSIVSLYPEARVICCVRNPAWILDSIETLLRKNALDTTRMFGSEAERNSIFSRAEALMGRGRLIGGPYLALKEAFHAAEGKNMLLLDYDTLTSKPQEALGLVYQFLGEKLFRHDIEKVSYRADEFDSLMLAKDLHTVTGRVEARTRKTILPPDLFQRFASLDFWTTGPGNAFRITPNKTS
jgi:sulfotransferase